MKKTVCELFAGVGGFRCGLNNIKTAEDYDKKEKWDTVWFNQWEPAEKTTQYAHDCYVYRFGTRVDIDGEDTTNYNIEDVNKADKAKMKTKVLPAEVGEVSETFQCIFENSGIMKDGIIYTIKTLPNYNGEQITLGDVMESGEVEEEYFIPEEKLYYTNPSVTHSDETEQRLPKEDRQTWQYLKGAKKLLRTSATGHEYVFSEGAISMIDQEDKPARTMLTSEGGFSRTTHIVKDKMTGRVRLLTATEAERIQGFPTNHTKYCLVKGKTVEMPLRKRRFMMGNALVVNLVADMEKTLDNIFAEE